MTRLELLDYGRFFAAIIVILFHYTFNGIVNGKITSVSHIPSIIEFTKYGYLGVELFFMVSGYVIFFSAKNRSASVFAVSRAIRLYPAYWFSILFTSYFALQWGGDLMSVYPTKIIVNFSMLQFFIGVGHVDGVYWTLVYEISFYFAVFLILLFGFHEYLRSIFIFWPIIFCVSFTFGYQELPYLGNYYYYFSAGALFGVLKDRFDWFAASSLLLVYVLCMIFSTGSVEQLEASKGVEYSAIYIGLIVTFFFVFFLYQNTESAQSLKLPMSKFAGAITYPIYLIHAHFGYMFISQFSTEENKIAIYGLTIFIVFVVAILNHKIVEIYFSQVWRAIFNKTLGRSVDYIQTVPVKIRNGCKKFLNTGPTHEK